MEERYDALVIGAGVAGLRAALAFADAGAHILVVTKDPPDRSSSGQAQGGIAVVLSGEEEEIILHADDTLRAGAGISDLSAVAALVRDGREEVLQLIEWGARFDRVGDRYHLTREAAHSLPRILHAGGDATGREIVRALVLRVRDRREVVRMAGALATDLLVEEGRIHGARVLDGQGRVRCIRSGAVVLATGGLGCCWKRTSNPEEATGDGLALGLRAGCWVGDAEFVQFHPTALSLPGAPSWLLSEALRGEGAVVRDAQGNRFLTEDDPRGELAPRDIVARGIARRIQQQGGKPVFLDLTGFPDGFIEKRFPGIVAACRRFGVDPLKEPIPVAPAAHYAMGGVVTDLHGRTTIRGLAAAGEVACTGVHGANRLASNSLLEGLVFGARAARNLLDEGAVGGPVERVEPPPWAVSTDPDPEEQLRRLRELADRELGIVRCGDRLAKAVAALECEMEKLGPPPSGLPTRPAVEAASAVLVLRAVARAALWREESRGSHFRSDFPGPRDDRFLVHSRQQIQGEINSAPPT